MSEVKETPVAEAPVAVVPVAEAPVAEPPKKSGWMSGLAKIKNKAEKAISSTQQEGRYMLMKKFREQLAQVIIIPDEEFKEVVNNHFAGLIAKGSVVVAEASFEGVGVVVRLSKERQLGFCTFDSLETADKVVTHLLGLKECVVVD